MTSLEVIQQVLSEKCPGLPGPRLLAVQIEQALEKAGYAIMDQPNDSAYESVPKKSQN